VVLLLPFVCLMGVSTIQAFAGDVRGDRLPAVLALITAAIALPAFMAVVGRSILRHAAAMDAERNELAELYDQARHNTQIDALLDPLTALGNHRAFQDELARQLEAVGREQLPLALLLVDVDDLRAVNEARGHVAGDEVLVTLGRAVATNLRRHDRASGRRRRVGDPPPGDRGRDRS
jgi:predicted signal transduction protein with EAL and GGDEF domain